MQIGVSATLAARQAHLKGNNPQTNVSFNTCLSHRKRRESIAMISLPTALSHLFPETCLTSCGLVTCLHESECGQFTRKLSIIQ